MPGVLLSLVLMLGLFTALGASAWAESCDVSYVDRWWDGSAVAEETKTVSATRLDGNFEGMLENGTWYYVEGSSEYDGRLTVHGGVQIILCDGASLSVTEGIRVNQGNVLNIYGQLAGSGELKCYVDSYSDDAAIGTDNEDQTCGTINVYGGKVTADGRNTNSYGAGIGGGNDCDEQGDVSISDNLFVLGAGDSEETASPMDRADYMNNHACHFVRIGETPVQSVSLNKTELVLTPGETVILIATVFPDDAADKSVSWSISDTNVAQVDENGAVRALACGEAVVTVTTVDGGKTATCAVKVEVEPDPVTYLDENGAEQICTAYTTVTPELGKKWAEGWYVVKNTGKIGGTIEYTGDIHLILCDDAALTAGGFRPESKSNGVNSFTVYAQSTGSSMGKLISSDIKALDYSVIINGGDISISAQHSGIEANDITINGGKLDASSVYGAGIETSNGDVVINGGEVSARGRYGIENINGVIQINGGKVTANGSLYHGLYAQNEAIVITGGEVSASGYVYGIFGETTVEIADSVVNAAATAPGPQYEVGAGTGIRAGSGLTISDSTVTAGNTSPDAASGNSYGLCVTEGDLTINSGTVTAAGDSQKYGLYASGTVTINGGTLTANGTVNAVNAESTVALEDYVTVLARDSKDSMTDVTATFESSLPQPYVYAECKGVVPPTADFVLPAGLVTIEESAFEGISAVTVEITANVRTVGPCAFASCPSLTAIIIPAAVKSIDNSALEGCSGVTVYGEAGSEAWRFAKENGIRFLPME